MTVVEGRMWKSTVEFQTRLPAITSSAPSARPSTTTDRLWTCSNHRLCEESKTKTTFPLDCICLPVVA